MPCSCSDNNSNNRNIDVQQVLCPNNCPQDCRATTNVRVPLDAECCNTLNRPRAGTIGNAAICSGRVDCTRGGTCQQTAIVNLCGNPVECCVEIPILVVTSSLSVTVSFPFTDACGRTVNLCQTIPVTLTNRCPACRADTACPPFDPCAYMISPPTIIDVRGIPTISFTVTTTCSDLGL